VESYFSTEQSSSAANTEIYDSCNIESAADYSAVLKETFPVASYFGPLQDLGLLNPNCW
jgi:hypothetical protein